MIPSQTEILLKRQLKLSVRGSGLIDIFIEEVGPKE